MAHNQNDSQDGSLRWQHRDQRRRSERERVKKHGARTASLYAAALRKRLREQAARVKSRMV